MFWSVNAHWLKWRWKQLQREQGFGPIRLPRTFRPSLKTNEICGWYGERLDAPGRGHPYVSPPRPLPPGLGICNNAGSIDVDPGCLKMDFLMYMQAR